VQPSGLGFDGVSSLRGSALGDLGEISTAIVAATLLAFILRHVRRESNQEFLLQSQLIQASSETTSRELLTASKFQAGVMPIIRETPYLKIETVFEPKNLVSGDVYAIYYNREKELNIFIGDASGHGVASAFLTMMVHIGLNHLRADLSPALTLHHLNEKLSTLNLGDMYLTGVFLRVSPSGAATFCNAGHPSLLHLRRETNEIRSFTESGLPIGLFNKTAIEYRDERIQLEKGDMILLYTDGILEWADKQEAQFGTERLGASLLRHGSGPLDLCVASILNDARSFAGSSEREDDMTMIGIQFKG
jgi:sigma-B regulation protein RsbU (phosphoserine phosphatase)